MVQGNLNWMRGNMPAEYNQNISFKIHSREITEKPSKGERPFLYVTHCLDLIYMSTYSIQISQRGIKVME